MAKHIGAAYSHITFEVKALSNDIVRWLHRQYHSISYNFAYLYVLGRNHDRNVPGTGVLLAFWVIEYINPAAIYVAQLSIKTYCVLRMI